jgi:hypothetical protein
MNHCQRDVWRYEYVFGDIPWVAAIELLAQICNQASELFQDKINGLLIVLMKALYTTNGEVDRALVCVRCHND